jgi:RNA ligase (TIGR02306 family)
MEFVRKLASVMRIDEVIEIPGADKVELVRLEGWQSVVSKGKHKFGDLVVYIETDALLPDKPEFAFMRDRKFRVKQIKLRGCISNGLVFSFGEVLPSSQRISEKVIKGLKYRPLVVGEDLTKLLGIEHYQKQAEEASVKNPRLRKKGLKGYFYDKAIKAIELCVGPINAMGPWPGVCPKSDEPRIDHIWNTLTAKYVGIPVQATEKMHGKSLTAYFYKGKFGVCSRNYELLSESTRPTTPFKKSVGNFIAKTLGVKITSQDQEDYWVYVKSQDLEICLPAYCETHNKNLAVQMELCGPKINGNLYKFNEMKAFVFNVWDIDAKRYYNYTEMKDLCLMLKLTVVPVVAEFALHDDMAKYVADVSVNSSVTPSSIQEGWVVRPIVEMRDPCIGRLSFKIISPLYKNLEDKLLGLG